jgi:hypothetical protein
MRVIGVIAKDVYVSLEITLEDMKKIKKVLQMSEFKYNSTVKEESDLNEFLVDELYPFIEGVIEGVENGH